MALPKIKHAIYEHTLVGSGKKVSFRPFTVQEQKILLLAKEESNSLESEDQKNKAILNAVRQILGNCTLGKVKIDTLATFDLEDLFLRIRAKSVGEQVQMTYRQDFEDAKSKFYKFSVNIDDVKVKTFDGHDKIIKLDDTLGIVMKYPTFEMLETIKEDSDMVKSCIDQIFDATDSYDPANYTAAEIEEFYQDIDAMNLSKIKTFFDTMPKLQHTVEIELDDGETQLVTFEGLKDFFS